MKITQCCNGMPVKAYLKHEFSSSASPLPVYGVLSIDDEGTVFICHANPEWKGRNTLVKYGYLYSWKIMDLKSYTHARIIPNASCQALFDETESIPETTPPVSQPEESKPVVKAYEWDGCEYTKDGINGITVECYKRDIAINTQLLNRWQQLYGNKT